MFDVNMESQKDVPLPLPLDDEEHDDRRLWIGNLDTRITEFTLLKLLQKYGKLEKFDFLYNKAGPDQGKPRGYCFITYETRGASEKAIKGLNGKMALSKRLQVRWAHVEKLEPPTKPKVHILGSNLGSTSQEGSESATSKISAIEAKLKFMEKSQNDFTLNTKPVGSLHKEQSMNQQSQRNSRGSMPYSRNGARR